ncbi:MAG: hypothetical protein QOJ70_2957 [Acidobacteriota bacterium]|nr:hypothetical protein [Acidobacteriota bacterium]
MIESTANWQGALIAESLVGAWRREPCASSVSADALARVTTLLSGSGAGALAWWKIRNSSLSEIVTADEFRQAYRLQTLSAAVREGEIESLYALLNSAGVDAVLVKGWAAGRAYPEQGLRPTGDIDLCVRPEQYRLAREVLASPEGRVFWVDLHEGFGRLLDCGTPELYERSSVLRVGRARVRVLSAEDHLRLLCLHLLRHGAWRPLWLCDVAVSLETRDASFNWARLCGTDPRRANWVACTLGLAREFLGASVEGVPAHVFVERVPRWLKRAVLRQWETPYATAHESPPLMRTYLRRPAGVLGAVRRRWPDPISASVHFGASFKGLPRLPYQLGKFLDGGARFLSRLPEEARASGRGTGTGLKSRAGSPKASTA